MRGSFEARGEEFFRTLVENSLDLITVADAEGKPIYINPAHERILGYTREEFSKLSISELLHPDDYERVTDAVAEHMGSPGSVSGFVEGRYRHKDGSWRWIEGVAYNAMEDPAVRGVLYCGRDITERKRAQEREWFLSLLVENSLDLITVVNPDFSLRYVSPSVETMLGYTPEQFTAFAPSDVIHPDDIDGVMNDMTEAVSDPGLNPVREYRIRHKDGSWCWLDATANNLFHEPGVKALVVNCRDITERKEAEAEIIRLNETLENRVAERTAQLEESEEQFRAAFEIAAVGMAQVDVEGRYLRVNPKLCETLGFTKEELAIRTYKEITHSDDLDAELEYVEQMLSGELETYSLEKRYIRKDRSRVWVNLTASLARGPSEEPRYFIQVAEEITKRKEAQLVLQSLTPREAEVLRHLALGKSNPQIAASTSFSLGSVKLQVRQILQKLEVSDRTQAAARAVELGLVSLEQRPERDRKRDLC